MKLSEKTLRFIRIRQLSGVRKAPGPRGTTIWSAYREASDAQKLKKIDDTYLGQIYWVSRWRRYSFFPATETMFEQNCLRKIADFCEEKTKDQKRRMVLYPRLGARRQQ